MDLWQFSCYLEGYVARCRQEELNGILLAMRFARYNNANRKTASDAKKEVKEIQNEIQSILTDNQSENIENENAEKKIEELKKQLKYFK